jgi:hypothetical protein
VIRDPHVISPLGVTAAQSWFSAGTLAGEMRRVLESCGLAAETVDSLDDALARAGRSPAGALVTYDSVAFSRSLVLKLLSAAADDARPALIAALPQALATQVLAHLDGMTATTIDGKPAFTAPLWIIRAGGTTQDAPALLLPFSEQEWKLPTPPGMLGRTEEPFGATDTYLLRVDHWAHVLRVNLAALVAHWFARWQTPSGKLWFLWRALLGFPWSGGRLARSLRVIHRKAKVHHTAHVELSVVEEGAEIGAHAIVKNSHIGRNARIDDGAIVNACVLGEGAMVASASSIFSCVLLPGAFAAQQKMQFSVLGENSVAFTGSYFYDLNFERNVRVVHRGRVVDAGTRFLSVCLGPWARVAGGVWVASGREIPAHALLVQPPTLVAQRIDESLASTRMTAVRDGVLVDVGPLPASAAPDTSR